MNSLKPMSCLSVAFILLTCSVLWVVSQCSVMISVTHYGTVSIVLISLTKYGTLPYCHDICDTLRHSINCLDISKNIWHTIIMSWPLTHYGTVSIVLISLTKYGTLPYCHDICDTLWHNINCLDISKNIWHNTILSRFFTHYGTV